MSPYVLGFLRPRGYSTENNKPGTRTTDDGFRPGLEMDGSFLHFKDTKILGIGCKN